jgi:hypothetical protein
MSPTCVMEGAEVARLGLSWWCARLGHLSLGGGWQRPSSVCSGRGTGDADHPCFVSAQPYPIHWGGTFRSGGKEVCQDGDCDTRAAATVRSDSTLEVELPKESVAPLPMVMEASGFTMGAGVDAEA